MALSLHHLGEASQGRAMGLDPQPGALTGASWAGWRRVAVARWGFFGGVSTNGPMYCQHCGLDQLKFGKELGRLPDRGQQTSSIGSQESRTFRLTVENGGIEKEPTSSRLIANPAASGSVLAPQPEVEGRQRICPATCLIVPYLVVFA